MHDIQLSVRFPKEVEKQLKQLKKEKGRSGAWIIREAIKEYYKKERLS